MSLETPTICFITVIRVSWVLTDLAKDQLENVDSLQQCLGAKDLLTKSQLDCDTTTQEVIDKTCVAKNDLYPITKETSGPQPAHL